MYCISLASPALMAFGALPSVFLRAKAIRRSQL